MKREIGSEFHYEALSQSNVNNIFEYLQKYNTVYFDSGRSSILAFLSMFKFKKVLMPSYICDCVINCFNGLDIIYYKIDKKANIDIFDLKEKIKDGVDLLYISFFNGYVSNSDTIRDLAQKNKVLVLEDTTHSIFTDYNPIGDFYICSLRKWFPIPDGGVLYSKLPLDKINIEYPVNSWWLNKLDLMKEKKKYLNCEIQSKDTILSGFRICEHMLDEQIGIYRISDESINILKNFDVNKMINIRRNNALYLLNKLKNSSIVYPFAVGQEGQIPLFFTIHTDKQYELRMLLIKNDVYCPIHWEIFGEMKKFDDSLYHSTHELSIPIDYRYGLDDMEYISNIILKEIY